MEMTPENAAMLAGQPVIPSTSSLDLPSGLARLLTMDTFNPAAPLTQPAGLMTSVSPAAMALTERMPMLPQYADGGMVGPGGAASPPTGAGAAMLSQAPAVEQYQETPMDPTQMHTTIDQQLAANPGAAEQIRGALMQGLQSGELTPQELNMGVQLIEAAVNNPSLYPQLRQFAVSQGIAGEEDLPPQYDKGFIMMLLTVAKSAQQLIQGGQPMQAMQGGGDVRGPANAPVPIMAHEGEYVVPKHVVGMKGREFFDKLVEKYSGGKQG